MDKILKYAQEKGLRIWEESYHLYITNNKGYYIRVSENTPEDFYVRECGFIHEHANLNTILQIIDEMAQQ